MHPAEETFIRSFIASHRRPRWLQLLASVKRRNEILNRLNHCAEFDPRYVRWLASNADAVGLLKSRGAPDTCRVLSYASVLDGREMPLNEAVGSLFENCWGTVLICIPDRLAFYYDEGGERRALLERAHAHRVVSKT